MSVIRSSISYLNAALKKVTILVLLFMLMLFYSCNNESNNLYNTNIQKYSQKYYHLTIYDKIQNDKLRIIDIGNKLLNENYIHDNITSELHFQTLDDLFNSFNDEKLNSKIKLKHYGLEFSGCILSSKTALILFQNNTLMYVNFKNHVYQSISKYKWHNEFSINKFSVIYIMNKNLFPIISLINNPLLSDIECQKYIYDKNDSFKSTHIEIDNINSINKINFPITNFIKYKVTYTNDTLIFKSGKIFKSIPLWTESTVYGGFVKK